MREADVPYFDRALISHISAAHGFALVNKCQGIFVDSIHWSLREALTRWRENGAFKRGLDEQIVEVEIRPLLDAASWGEIVHHYRVDPDRIITSERVFGLEASPPHRPDTFQWRAASWCAECFGVTTATDRAERNARFLEEALELVQSLGLVREDAHALVDYVFDRPGGEPPQETGGVMVTLAALCGAAGLSMTAEGERELDRISKPEMINRIRAKHASKPHRSPLPGDYRHADSAGEDDHG